MFTPSHPLRLVQKKREVKKNEKSRSRCIITEADEFSEANVKYDFC